MIIIIHRTKLLDLVSLRNEIIARLSHIIVNDRKVVFDSLRNCIKIDDDIIVEFRGGTKIYRFGGIRPDIYNTDNALIRDVLEQSAQKVNGIEVKDVSEIIRMIVNTDIKEDKDD